MASVPSPPVVPSLVPTPGPLMVPNPAASGGAAGAAPSGLGDARISPDGGALPVGRIIDELHEQRNQDWTVSVVVASERVRIGKDRLRFRLRSERDGYVYLLMQGTDQSHFYQLFPNGLDKNNRVRKDVEMALPRPDWEMVAGGPAGLNRFVALVTPSPRDFSGAGLNSGQPFSEFDLSLAGQVFAHQGAAPFAGKPAGCRLDAQACASYGAALFEIEEY